jgi:uncharacterized protein (TIGR02646 family)
MIHQLNNIFILTDEQENHMSGIPDSDKPDEWVKTNAFMTNIRASITAQLDGFQNQKCCYCGLDLWETGRGEIEHIAPKSSRQRAYPEFTFEKQNLALACEYCNGSSKKGETDIVLRYSPTYSNCEFKLVHPYFDNPNDHYEWINNKTQIVVRHRTWKGKYSIILFHLHKHANARAKQHIYERKVNRLRIYNNIIDRFKQIISF